MMDVVNKSGDRINIGELSRELGCRIVEISALKGTGIREAAGAAVDAAKEARPIPAHPFSSPAERAVARIGEAGLSGVPPERRRWYAVKLFERDEKVLAQLNIPKDTLDHMSVTLTEWTLPRSTSAEAICSVKSKPLGGAISAVTPNLPDSSTF